MRLIKVFVWGMMVSFFGTLPLTNLNVAAMQISASEGIRNGFYFSVGSLLTEMIYVRISLVGVEWVKKQKRLFYWLEWITIGIVIALAIGSFIAATSQHHAKNVLLNNNINRFWLGILMSSITPMQIVFWFGWSTVLFSKKILKPNNADYNFYIAGIGLGTFLGNCVFILGGKYIVDKLDTHQNILNWIIGGIFIITAIIQLVRLLRHTDASEQLNTMEKPPIQQ
jgi:threonine/homoserine/homoserine lactone efflux protein